jgi:radical SAM-linked protein
MFRSRRRWRGGRLADVIPDTIPDLRSGAPTSAPITAGARQRWRIVFGRSAETATAAHRDVAAEWLAALDLVLPLARSEGSRKRPALTFAAPLPVGVSTRRELADLALAERLPAWQVREAVRAAAPDGIDIGEVFDVWVGAPAIVADVAAADYVVTLRGDPDPNAIRQAATRLLGATRLERRRVHGERIATYDLRPLVDSIEIADGPPAALLIRTRFHPERGAGRPEEVLAALAELADEALDAAETTRERVLLSGDLV